MTTNELPLEKRIAAEIDVDLSNPPVVPEEVLNNPGAVPIHGHPSSTGLLLEGVEADELTTEFLVGVHDLADEYDLSLDGISVGQRESIGR